MNYTIQQERLTPENYIEFLRHTDLGSQYPKERFRERIAILVEKASISLTARDADGALIGVASASPTSPTGCSSRTWAWTGTM